MGPHEGFEDVIVLAVDDRVPRPVAAAGDFAGGDQTGVDHVAELGDDDQVGQRSGSLRLLRRTGRGGGRVGRVEQFQVGMFAVGRNFLYHPQPLIALRGGPARRKDADLVAPADRAPWEFDGFRHMPLEVQSERAAIRQGGDLPLQVVSEHLVVPGNLADQVVEA